MDNPVRDKVAVSGLIYKLATEVMGLNCRAVIDSDGHYSYDESGFDIPGNYLTDLNDCWPLLAKVYGKLAHDRAYVYAKGICANARHNGPSDIPSVCRAIVRAVSLAKGFVQEEDEIDWEA